MTARCPGTLCPFECWRFFFLGIKGIRVRQEEQPQHEEDQEEEGGCICYSLEEVYSYSLEL